MSSKRNVAWVAVVASLLASACSEDKKAGTPITIGLIAPKSGALEQVGGSFERVAKAAVAEINAKGGVNGHPLVLIVKDDGTDKTKAVAALEELIDVDGAVAVVGPATSDAVELAYPTAANRKVPIVSPSATAPKLAKVTDDDGYMFRNVPDDLFQALAIVYYLRQKASPAITSVLIVQENSAYGDGLAGAFTTAFTAAGGTVSGTIEFDTNLTDDGAAVATKLGAATPVPTMVVMIALEKDGKKIANAWAKSGKLADLEWFFTDGARSSGFLEGLDDKLSGSLGTAPTFPATGDAYGVLQDRYNAANDDDIGSQVFATNVWDAVFQIAAALAQQEHDFPDEPLGGPRLRDALTKVSRGPGLIFHAGQWRDLIATIAQGGDVDYDGASGPCDFLDTGETIGPYEVWRINGTGTTKSFGQALFLEAQAIEGLLTP